MSLRHRFTAMANFPSMLTDDRYLRFSRTWRVPEFLAAVLALVTLIADIGWSRSLGLSQWLTFSLESVLVMILLARVPAAMLTPLPEFVEESRPVADRKRRKSQRKNPVMRLAGAFSQRFRLRRRVPATMEPFRRVIVRCPGEGVVFLLAILGLSLTSLADDPVTEFQRGVQLTLFGASAMYAVNVLRNFQRLRVPPLLLFTGTYCALILLGALLLSSPRSSVTGDGMSLVDSLFMSASASCVTGLSVIDVGRDLSLTGQVILMVLIQIGGLGIMTFAAFASIMVGAGMSIRDRRAISEVLNYDVVGRVGKLVLWILGITLTCEVIGAAIMYGNWSPSDGTTLTAAQQAYWSVFHSISAFCNAGFSLDQASLTPYGGAEGTVRYSVMVVMGALVVLGGIGFTCIMELSTFRFWHLPVVRRMKWVGKFTRRHPVPRLSLQTKVVLMATTTLIVGGAVVFWVLESGTFGGAGVMKGQSGESQLAGAVFQGGITARTAGFNTLDVGSFQPETQFFMILKMLVGASPGSTGGGIKTTAMVILLLVLWSSLRGRPPEMFRRRINDDQVRRVLLALVTILIILNLAVFFMLMTEANQPHGGKFMPITFEVVSAFTTTGLSTGITNDVSDAGRVILSICMFLGRVGPITLVLALGRRASARYEYPGESMMLG